MMQRETDIFGLSPHQNLCSVIGKKVFWLWCLWYPFCLIVLLLTCPMMQQWDYLHGNETEIAKIKNINDSRQRIFLMMQTRKPEAVMKESWNLNLGLQLCTMFLHLEDAHAFPFSSWFSPYSVTVAKEVFVGKCCRQMFRNGDKK